MEKRIWNNSTVGGQCIRDLSNTKPLTPVNANGETVALPSTTSALSATHLLELSQ
jgi:hypothetical protein